MFDRGFSFDTVSGSARGDEQTLYQPTGVSGSCGHDRRELCADVEAAWRLLQEAEVRLASAVADWDRRDGWVGDGALSASGWLRHRLAIGHGHAVGILKFSRGLRDFVDIADAITDGVLSTDKAQQLLAKFTPSRSAYVERDLQTLIDQAARLTVNQCKTLLAVWAARVDAEIESAEATENASTENASTENSSTENSTTHDEFPSELFVSEITDGEVVINGSLNPELGETFRTALDLARRMIAGERLGDSPADSERLETSHESSLESSQESSQESGHSAEEPPSPVDDRSPAEQRAEALGLLARFFLDHNDDIATSAGARPHVQVEIDLEVLEQRVGGLARVQHGSHGLAAEDARRFCCDCDVSRIITRGRSEVIDVGRKTRVVPVATARAVRRRDRHCRFPGCDLGYRFTEIHHFVHWINGGPTNLGNLFLLCWRHHRMVHRKGPDHWTVTGHPNAALVFTSPGSDVYTTGPPG